MIWEKQTKKTQTERTLIDKFDQKTTELWHNYLLFYKIIIRQNETSISVKWEKKQYNKIKGKHNRIKMKKKYK